MRATQARPTRAQSATWARATRRWNEGLYRVWYLIGAFFVAAYLGAGTIYLLSRSRFGYFAGATVLLGGLLSLLFSHLADKSGAPLYPGSATAGTVAFVIATLGGLAIIAATALKRGMGGHIPVGALVIGPGGGGVRGRGPRPPP